MKKMKNLLDALDLEEVTGTQSVQCDLSLVEKSKHCCNSS